MAMNRNHMAAWMRRFAAAALTCAAAGASGQTPALTLHVEAGIGDAIRSGAPAPVRVRLSNQGAETYDGRVGVAFEGVLSQSPSVWVWSDVQMAAGAEKLIHLTLPPGDSPVRIAARYETDRGQRIGETSGQVRALPAALPCILSIGAAPRSLPAQPEDGAASYTALVLAPELAPLSHEGLAMFDAVVIAPSPYAPLSQAQIAALRDWVLRGGILVIDASQRTEFFRSDGLAALSPYMPVSALQGDLGLFGEALRYTAGTVTGGDVIWSAGDTPLLIRKRTGLGAVYCYTVDTDSPAFLKLDEAPRTWNTVFAPLAIGGDGGAAQPVDFASPMREAMTRSMESGPKSSVRLGAVVLLTLLYALVVGPGDYFLIRALRRPRLTWLTFPAIVTVFTAVAYFGAKTYIGGELEAVSRVRVLALLDDDAAIRQTVNSVFAPSADTYAIAAIGPTPLTPLQQGFAAGEYGIDMYPDKGAVEHDIPVWTQRFYTTDQAADPPPIGFAVTAENGRVIAEIRNDSSFTLRENVFAFGRFYLQVAGNDAIGPGETRRIDIASLDDVRRDNLQIIPATDYDGLRIGADFFAQRLALYRSVVDGAFGAMRAYNLRLALDQGAAVWICRAETPGAEPILTVDGEPGAAPGSMELQLVTYEGAQL